MRYSMASRRLVAASVLYVRVHVYRCLLSIIVNACSLVALSRVCALAGLYVCLFGL